MKLVDLGELLKHSAAKPDQQTLERVVDEKDKAGKMQMLYTIIPAGAQGSPMHYHTQRESLILVLSGEGKEIIDGNEYPVKANSAVFILPNEKHKIENTGRTELKYIEIYTLPSDFIPVK